jgi:hypothetical protein
MLSSLFLFFIMIPALQSTAKFFGHHRSVSQLSAAGLDLAVRNSPLWCEKARLLRGVPAVGNVSVTTLLAHLPELGTALSMTSSLRMQAVSATLGFLPAALAATILGGRAASADVVWFSRCSRRRLG